MDLMAGSVSRHRMRDGTTRYRVRIRTEGKRKSLGLYTDPAEARAVLAAALDRMGDTLPGHTLATWGAVWFDRRETAPHARPRAIAKERNAWATHVVTAPFAGWPLRRIARTDVVAWVKQLGRTEATRYVGPGKPRKPLGRTLGDETIRNALGLLRRALGEAADEGLVPHNVALGVKVKRTPRTDDPWDYLRRDEVPRLFALELRPVQRALYAFLIHTGLRAGEAFGLRWRDVQLDGAEPEAVVRVSYRDPTKGGRVRHVPLLAPAVEALREWRQHMPGVGHALVFPASGGGCHAEGFDAGFARVRRLAGIERAVTIHDLRHTCGTALVNGWWGEEWPLKRVQQMLGHRSITTTERYAHHDREGLQAVAKRTARR